MKAMNTWSKRNLLMVMVFLLVAFSLKAVIGFPSGKTFPPTGFTFKNENWYDSWEFKRSDYSGADGYMPNIAYETLGANKELAYSIGEQFRTSYANRVQRAVAILDFVQRWTDYGHDADNARAPDGTAQSEWAWNADEMAHMFNTTTNTVAIGDCEDMAFLCATIYIGAGFDAAMVLAPSDAPNHAALVIWLPEYPNANYYWDIDDGRGYGWIWVESTGEHNPLGWTPPDFNNGDWTAYPLGLMIFGISYAPQNPQAEDSVTVTASVINTTASVSQVSLDYFVQGVHNTLPMTLKGITYEAIIPKQSDGTTVEFFISAIDSEGNTRETDKFSYRVGGAGIFEILGFSLEQIIILVAIGIVLLVFVMAKKPKSAFSR